jgi:inner membrane protein
VVEQRDRNTFTIHPVSKPDELYQVSSRSDMGHQIVSERITGKVGRKVRTSTAVRVASALAEDGAQASSL